MYILVELSLGGVRYYSRTIISMRAEGCARIIQKEEKTLKIAAYQFAISNDIEKNYNKIEKAILEAKKQGVCLIIF